MRSFYSADREHYEELIRQWNYFDNDPANVRITSAYINPNYEIKNVIFNPPATIVFWADGSKTVVKAQNGEKFDPEKGLSMAIAKKHFGNKGHYFEVIKKWAEKYDSNTPEGTDPNGN